jgi:hypothetical protein
VRRLRTIGWGVFGLSSIRSQHLILHAPRCLDSLDPTERSLKKLGDLVRIGPQGRREFLLTI